MIDLSKILPNPTPIPDNPNKWLWDNLVTKIVKKDVIPVIGPDLLLEEGINAHDYIIKACADAINIQPTPRSFSELVYNDTFKNIVLHKREDNIYYFLNDIFTLLDAQPQNIVEFSKLLRPSSLLKRLLEIRQFPFVITTSFTPVVEQIMRNVWQGKLRVMRFCNNPAKEEEEGNDDIENDMDLRKPTVYYMFGKVGESPHRYALTDIDMLNFCSSWLSDGKRPTKLCNALKNKYLLMLGNNYSDWLFRFIWYSMHKDNMGEGMFTFKNDTLDENLIAFLMRVEAFTMQDPCKVVDEIVRRLNERLPQPPSIPDFFISYSRSDSDVAEKLYQALTRQGKKVWLDKTSLRSGSNFNDEIYHAIDTAKYFIPIFSNNVLREKDQRHVYRKEWNRALDVAVSLGRTFIIPLAEKGFDFYKAHIPEQLQHHNAIFYDREDSMDEIAENIIHTINEE